MNTTAERQSEHLKKVVHWAREIRTHLQTILDAHRGQVHFRPSSGGVAMVGLTPERPQRGRSGIKNVNQLADNFEAEFRKHCIDIDQGRPTAEKALQSWMIAEAQKHDGLMTSINIASSSSTIPVSLRFITDEIVIPTTADGRGRIVCDILALRQVTGGFVPVAIELKTARQLKRLVEQVAGYAALVDEHRGIFEELYSATLGQPVRFVGPCEKWIVWPTAGEEKDPRERELANVGIRVVGYVESGDGFDFRVETASP